MVAYVKFPQADSAEHASQNSPQHYHRWPRTCFVAWSLVAPDSYCVVPPMRNQFLLNERIVQLTGEGSIDQDSFPAPVVVLNGRRLGALPMTLMRMGDV